ncbi:MAG: glycosyltransferase [Alphaproteobacteria bacterium]
MRVLQAMAGSTHGGAENFFIRLVTALSMTGIDQRVIIRRNAERMEQLRAHGIDPLELRFGGMWDIFSKRRFAQAIKEFQPSLVCTWMNRATAACPHKTSGYPFIHIGRLGGYYDLKYYRQCNYLVGNTHHIVDYVVRHGWPKDRVHYLPNFVDSVPGRTIPRSQFDLPPEGTILLVLGRLHPNKAIDIAIEALTDLPDHYLLIAGEGPLQSQLIRQTQDLKIQDRVRFLGWRSDSADLIATCDIFLCPSRHEPLGNVVLEAFAQGTPVVAAASSGPSALITDKKNGLLFPVDNVSALTQCIKSLGQSRDFRDSLANSGYQTYNTQFSKEIVLQQWLDFFTSLTTKV